MMRTTFVSLYIIFILGTLGQDIMFPDDDNIEERLGGGNNTKLTERVPIDIEGRCPLNMLLYPGDGDASVWECDCKVGFLYFPLNDSCYPAYRQGPCPPQNYAILPQGEVIPKCEKNPCLEDGLVPYNNTCYELKKIGGPCPPGQYLIVNETTFQIECEKSSVAQFTLIQVPANRCPNGSRRNALGQCRKML